MSTPQPINIVVPPANDKAVITGARWGVVAVLIAALITSFASLLGTTLTIVANLQQRDDWKLLARNSGWIPRSECEWDSISTISQDNNGKKVTILIHMLSGEYRWVYTSSTEIELGDEKKDLRLHIQGLDVSKSKIIVAVGMASVEGDFDKQSVLSEERTDKLISLIKEELKPRAPVHGLSLGRYIDEKTKSNPRATSNQRRVVVMEVLDYEEGIILKEAVYNALVGARNSSAPIPFDVRNYKDRNYTDHTFGNL